jgi:hypothetical protein
MMHEARNTDRHAFSWGSDRLRDNKISFVSAGTLTRDELPQHQDEESSSEEQDMNDHDKEEEEPDNNEALVDIPNDPTAAEFTADLAQATQHVTLNESPAPANPHLLDQDMSSDEDELVFAGRNGPSVSRPVKEVTPKPVSEPIQTVESASNTPLIIPPPAVEPPSETLPAAPAWAFQDDDSSDIQINTTPSRPHPSSKQQSSSNSKPEGSNDRSRAVNYKYRNSWRAQKSRRQREQDEAVQDYMDNLAQQQDDDDEDEPANSNKPHRRNETFRFYDGAAETHVKVQTKSTAPKHLPLPQAIDWSSADLEDFDDLSTTDEEVTYVGQVLRHRERPSGPQYLVTAIGESVGDAKWMLHSNLVSSTAIQEIQIYEEIRALKVDFTEETSGSESDSASDSEEAEALRDLNDDIESEADENTRAHKRAQRMTDEEIAHALAKQEALGLGGDELLIFDENQANDSPDVDMDDEFANAANFIPFSLTDHTSNRNRSKRNRRQRDSFPSASAFADALDQDAYGAFDVMDFDRPSLRPRKGKKGAPRVNELIDYGLDEEMALNISNTWQKDRDKKAQRKMEKMDARAAALYEAGERSHPEVIKAEIRMFMCDEDQDELKLASMPPDLRAGVHRLAKSLKLHSRSEGKENVGAGRFPVLTKTTHTPYYNSSTIHEIDALLNLRKFFPKHSGGHYRGPRAVGRPVMKKNRDKGGFGAASYANGEVVGGTAPELGAENRGRLLLEKMGWSSGMGIGKEGNEGGLEHIKHVVKTGKAGLG